jgi:hypothetical protein
LTPRRALTVVIGGVCALQLALIVWGVTGHSAAPARSDFAPYYAAGTLIRGGDAQHAYDPRSEAQVLRATGLQPQPDVVLPAWAPPALLVALPLSVFPLPAALAIWSALQLAAVVAAAVIGACWAGLRHGVPRSIAILIAAAGPGTLLLATLGQWDGLAALTLGAALILWGRGRDGWAAAMVAAGACAAKPHLAIGLGLFALARSPLRASLGLAAGAAAVLVPAVVLLGPASLQHFAELVRTSAGTWPPHTMVGAAGLVADIAGDGQPATAVGLGLSAVCALLCLPLGLTWRRQLISLDRALFAAVCLSLLAAPHLYHYDLVLLTAPVAALLVRSTFRPALALIACWVAVTVLSDIEVLPPGTFTPGPGIPLGLAALAVVAVLLPVRREASPPLPAVA